ncbi:MAG: HD-GYP domain-containing protein [Rhodoferax sp.]|nr:MAG: HD-GYP domain-containing protein [Rhodoferax sp.]
MQKEVIESVDISQLRLGLYVVLDIGWLSHPFPTSSFKLTNPNQIDTLRSLGLKSVKVDWSRSDAVEETGPAAAQTPLQAAQAAARAAAEQLAAEKAGRQAMERAERARMLATQQKSLQVCEKRYLETGKLYRQVQDISTAKPKDAAQQSSAMVASMLTDMAAAGEISIRLLSESAGEKSAQHPVNVMIVSLLLARAMGLPAPEMQELGVAAFLHDIGKQQVPDRVRSLVDGFNAAETRLYQEHVSFGVQAAKAMGLSTAALLAIAQHHEGHDGSGFPKRSKGDEISPLGRILSVVNRYDNLVNPARASAALTPHEALAAIFSQYKAQCEPSVLSAFIRMMGIYPPGSVVQLSDERYALVVAVNSTRPLKPSVVVHEPRVPRHEALVMDLEKMPELSIRRSVKPSLLPAASLDYLAPRLRVNYFFEASDAVEPSEAAA